MDNYIYRGDIYYVYNEGVRTADDKRARPAIIVSNDNYSNMSSCVEVVYLTSQKKTPMNTHVSVVCHTPSTAMCESIFTVEKDRLGDFVRQCTNEEMEAIDNALMFSLGIKMPVSVVRRVETSADKKLEIKLEIYKGLYDELLSKMTKGTS